MAGVRTWLALATQLPSHPAYLRVKVWRRLRETGAVTLAGGLHVLPDEPAYRNAFKAVATEVEAQGGQVALMAAELLAGTNDPTELFLAARSADYRSWTEEAVALTSSQPKVADVIRMRRRLDKVVALDFFEASGRTEAEACMAALVTASLQHPDVSRADPGQPFRAKELHGRTWVTRRGIGVDRIASAWLIQRFIDPRPRFRFVDPDRYVHQRRDLRFDMADGEFTHEGDHCSFETLLHRTGVPIDPGLGEIAKIIHQLDIDDGQYDHPDAGTFAKEISSVCSDQQADHDRLSAGFIVLSQLHSALRDGQQA